MRQQWDYAGSRLKFVPLDMTNFNTNYPSNSSYHLTASSAFSVAQLPHWFQITTRPLMAFFCMETPFPKLILEPAFLIETLSCGLVYTSTNTYRSKFLPAMR